MEYKGVSIEWLGHDSFRVKAAGKVLYIDPYKISGGGKAGERKEG